MDREILMPCWAKDLESGMIVKYNTCGHTSLTVEYLRSASSDFTWIKFKEFNKETLLEATEKFEVILNEEYIDKNRNEFGGVPMWCVDACGKMKYDWIDRVKN